MKFELPFEMLFILTFKIIIIKCVQSSMQSKNIAKNLREPLTVSDRKKVRGLFTAHLVETEQDPRELQLDPDYLDAFVKFMGKTAPEWRDLPEMYDTWDKFAIKHLVKTLFNCKYDHCAPLLKKMEAVRNKQILEDTETEEED